MPVPLQAAAIGAFVSAATTLLGVVVVFLQLGRQARNAIRQNRHNEALKLKLDIYKTIVEACTQATDALIGLSNFLRLFGSAMHMHRLAVSHGGIGSTPAARIPELIRLKGLANAKVIEFVCLIERWLIVDPRVDVFKIAFNVALHDLDTAYGPYFEAALPLMPHDHPQGGETLPWTLPSEETAHRLEGVAQRVIDAVGEIEGYIYDFQVEMQNLLLSELFDRRVTCRVPIGPHIVVRLDRHEELMAHFRHNTPWGERMVEAEAAARRALADASEPQG